MDERIEYRSGGDLPAEQVLALYQANGWSSAEKPEQLLASLAGSHAVATAWHGDRLVGLGNTLSDGHLVVYYSHLLVHPDFRRRGIGRRLAEELKARYEGFHQHVLLADGGAVDFYRKLGFVRAGDTMPMWIYAGADHGISEEPGGAMRVERKAGPER